MFMGCGGSKAVSTANDVVIEKPVAPISDAVLLAPGPAPEDTAILRLDSSERPGPSAAGASIQEEASSIGRQQQQAAALKYRTMSSKNEMAQQQVVKPAAAATTAVYTTPESLPRPSNSAGGTDRKVDDQSFFDINQPPQRSRDGTPAEPVVLKTTQSVAAERGADAPVLSEDPWASLQSQYNIQPSHSRMQVAADEGPTHSGLYGGGGSGKAGPAAAAAGRAVPGRRAAPPPVAASELVLDDVGAGGLQAVPQVTTPMMRSIPRGGGGGWDKGNMAKAGTIMVEETDLDLDMYGATHPVPSAQHSSVEERAPPPQKFNGRTQNDVTELNMEDFDEIDSLLKDEMKEQGMSVGPRVMR